MCDKLFAMSQQFESNCLQIRSFKLFFDVQILQFSNCGSYLWIIYREICHVVSEFFQDLRKLSIVVCQVHAPQGISSECDHKEKVRLESEKRVINKMRPILQPLNMLVNPYCQNPTVSQTDTLCRLRLPHHGEG